MLIILRYLTYTFSSVEVRNFAIQSHLPLSVVCRHQFSIVPPLTTNMSCNPDGSVSESVILRAGIVDGAVASQVICFDWFPPVHRLSTVAK
jgi:hypothetical protein